MDCFEGFAAPLICESGRSKFGVRFDAYFSDLNAFSLPVSRIVNSLNRRKLSRTNYTKSSSVRFGVRQESQSHLSSGSVLQIHVLFSYDFVKGITKSDAKMGKVFVKVGQTRMSRSEAGLVEKCQSNSANGAYGLGSNLTLKNPVHNSYKLQCKGSIKDERKQINRKIWLRVHNLKKSTGERMRRTLSENNGRLLEYEDALSAISLESSLEECNCLLKLLENISIEKTLNFFKWMKSNGKLKNNTDAYNLVLRAMARKEFWAGAEKLIQEMALNSHCPLTIQQFKILVYACAKRGLVEQSEKWFHVMLERKVQPDVAIIGMLMSLYQKNSSTTQAELVFAYMRNHNLRCVAAYSSMMTIYTRLGMYEKSTEVINLMEEDQVLPDLQNWLVRLNVYCQQGKVMQAETVLKSMLEIGISPNIVAYNTLITGYGKVSDMKSAELLFQRLQSIGLEPDEATYRSMVEGFGRINNYQKTLWYYEKLKGEGFLPSSSNFYTLINLQARHRDDQGIIRTFQDMRTVGCHFSTILGSLLRAYERVGGIDRVPAILRASFYDNILLDQTSCSILVMSYGKNAFLDDALQVLSDKRWNDSDFEDNLYHLLICSCKEAGRFEDALKIYLQMPKSDMEPNLHITSSMIDIYSAMQRFADAENLFVKLKSSGIPLDVVAYSVTVRMYVKSGSLKDACLVLDMMEKQKHIIPDKFLFFDMLRVYQQCGMREKLADVYYQILRSGVEVDEAMCNCIINCCGRALPVDELSRFFNEMIENGHAASTITFNVLMDIYGKAGFLQKATDVFWMARRQGREDIISYNTIIAAFAKIKDFVRMRWFVKRMQHAGYPVSLEAYNSMLDAYGKDDDLEEFNDVLEKMKQASCESDHYTYNIMINIYGKKGWIEDVAKVLAELKERGLEPDLYSYNTLIKAYGIAGMVEEAAKLVQEMREKGVEPDRVTYSNLIVALQRNENFLEAVKWSLWMKQMGMHS